MEVDVGGEYLHQLHRNRVRNARIICSRKQGAANFGRLKLGSLFLGILNLFGYIFIVIQPDLQGGIPVVLVLQLDKFAIYRGFGKDGTSRTQLGC